MSGEVALFARVPHFLLDDDTITASAVLVFTALSSFAAGNECFPGIEKVAKRAHLSKNAARSGLLCLKEHKYVTVEHRRNGSRQKTNLYRLRFQPANAEPSNLEASNSECSGTPVVQSATNAPELDKKRIRQERDIGGKNLEKGEPEKQCYGNAQKVLLTDKEYSDLVAAWGESTVRTKIEDLADYMASKGKVYKDHAATIRSWIRKDARNALPNFRPTSAAPSLPRSTREVKCPFCGTTIPAGSIGCPKCKASLHDIEASPTQACEAAHA